MKIGYEMYVAEKNYAFRQLSKYAVGWLLLPLGLVIADSTMFTAIASASLAVNKSFAPIAVSTNQSSRLTIDLFNSNATAANGVSITDNLPAGLQIATPANITTTCGGTITAIPGSGVISLTGGTIPAAVAGLPSSCQVGVDVVSTTANSYVNAIPAGAILSSQGTNPLSANATLIVSPSAPLTGSKVFSPANLHGNGSASTLTIGLNNPNSYALLNTAFTDNFPSGLKLTATPNATTSCGGGIVTAIPGSSTISLSGATIPAVGSCNVTVQVEPSTPNVVQDSKLTNTIPASGITTSQGITNASAISGAVQVQTGAAIAKSFSPAVIQAGQTSVLKLTLQNFDGTAITPANLVDNMPANVTVTGIVANTCGGIPSFTATQFQLLGGTIPAAPIGLGFGSCDITANVTSSQTGAYTNSIPVGNFNGVNYNIASANLQVNPATSVALTKAFASSTGILGGQSNLTITLTNTASSPANITAFSDNLTTMGTGFTVAASPTASTTCGGTVNAAFGSTNITKTNGTIPANSSCTIIVPVAIATNASTGNLTNSIAADSLQTDQGSNSFPVTANLNVQGPVSVKKAFSSSGNIVQGGQTNLTLTLANATSNPASITSFTDNLTTMGTGFTVAPSPVASTTCGGTVNATAGSTSITKTDGIIPANASCTITVPILAAINTLTTTSPTNTVLVNGLQTNLGNNTTAANDTVTVSRAVTVSKAFAPSTVYINGTSRLTININRAAGAPALTGINLTDNLPVGLTINPIANVANTCGGIVNAPPLGTAIALTGGSLLGGSSASSCRISLDVKAPGTVGSETNTIPANSLTTNEGATYNRSTSATLSQTNSYLTLNKGFSPTSIAFGGSSTFTLLVLNNNPNAVNLTNVALTDLFPTGMTIAPVPNATFTGTGCTGATITAPPGSNQLSISGASIKLNAICTLSVKVTSNFAGNLTNELPIGTATSGQGTSNLNKPSATLTLFGTGNLQVTKDDGITTIAPSGTTVYTVRVKNNGPDNIAGATFTDIAPLGMTINSWACAATPGSSCNVASGTGDVNIELSLLNQGEATFTIDATVNANVRGSITNVAQITPPPSVTDSDGTNNIAQDTDTIQSTGQPGKPTLLLVKRITAINGGTSTVGGDNLTLYKDDPTNPYDDNIFDNPVPTPIDTDKWLDPTTFLIGGINGGNIKPGDEMEYTIYFLSAGDTTANHVLFCDRVPTNVSFIPTAFNSVMPQATGGLTGDRGILSLLNGTTTAFTNTADGDAARYFAPGIDPASVYPNIKCGGTNNNGAIVVNLGDLPNATVPGTPAGAFGFVRFKGRVK
jgi:uncharacterized repeat protein (TIGR01451 family)